MHDKQPETIEKEKYLRLAADFDNFRKRIHAEMKHAIAGGNEKLLLEIADVLDAVERATGEYDMGKLLEQILKKHGLVRIETKGQPFDPNTMEAVSMVEGRPEQSQQVQSEVRAGWMMGSHVIRPARVIIYS
jgi:molecular chaperone GrpE